MKYKDSLVVFLILMAPFFAVAQVPSLYEKGIFIDQQDTLRYRIMWPENFDATKEYPVVLFLHGAGERGHDNTSQLTHGSSLFTDVGNRNDYPAIIIFPQCPKNDYWSNVKVDRSRSGVKKFRFKKEGTPTKAMDLLLNYLDAMVGKPFIKKDQIYVVGLSMGGMGTFEILARRPNLFAAAMPICGGGNPKSVSNYASNVPIWAFHGAKDDVVSPVFSIHMIEEIIEKGGTPKFSLYDTANHNSWDPAFNEPEFLSWLFSKRRNENIQK
ncbi:prolyl oligopeptidase family serine peptidase [Flavobacteriaceae bacterium KMM 6897]|nr:prolyl oligopeptidase family serine peptidase [Flavobacteriaceae bacterium KMM 6897]MEB8347181.1 prolyl oligopeptidase family serine peptidase [Flavobacteriaceae bacterium KMM 6898]